MLDPLLHQWRRRDSHDRVARLLPQRPQLYTLQPPTRSIYLTRTHVAARRLHWALVSIRLNQRLSRRPRLSTLVSKNIVPKECCRRDRTSGEFVWGAGLAGALVHRKRNVEREHVKAGLRVWLERKVREMSARRQDGGVGILVWRFSQRLKVAEVRRHSSCHGEQPAKGNVSRLRRVFEEGLGSFSSVARSH